MGLYHSHVLPVGGHGEWKEAHAAHRNTNPTLLGALVHIRALLANVKLSPRRHVPESRCHFIHLHRFIWPRGPTLRHLTLSSISCRRLTPGVPLPVGCMPPVAC